jgi:nitroreductase/NAD-dependent dihydropyrimidine dehydrogenase PreA subunit
MIITIDPVKCTTCGYCSDECPARIFRISESDESPKKLSVQFSESCNRCGHCVAICPHGAISHSELTGDFAQFLPPLISPEHLTDLLLSRRSTRAFQKRPVPRDLIEKLIDIGTHAGSASNAQTEGFVVIQDEDRLKELENLVVETMWKRIKILGSVPGRTLVSLRYGRETTETSRHYYERFKAILEHGEVEGSVFRGAPVVIAVEGTKTNRNVRQNAAIALRNMEILALSCGLGTCWAGFLLVAADMTPQIGEYLGLPRGRNVYGALMVGYPKHRYGRKIPRAKRAVRWL